MNKNKDIEQQKRELEELKEEREILVNVLETQEKKKNNEFHKRNLKFLGKTGILLAPFFASAGIILGVIKLIGGGFPFVIDDYKKYKKYSLEYNDENHIIELDEEFESKTWLDKNDTSNIEIYTPWELKNGIYERIKTVYNLDKLDSLELFNAVLNRDTEYISKNINNYVIETQTTNAINENIPNDYIINANLNMLDKEKFIICSEGKLANICISAVYMFISVGLGILLIKEFNYDYKWEIERINIIYDDIVRTYNEAKKHLDEVDQNILSLSKKYGGDNNEQ